eukprot:scaffold67602_cov45-Attheya_sp.AAC.1
MRQPEPNVPWRIALSDAILDCFIKCYHETLVHIGMNRTKDINPELPPWVNRLNAVASMDPRIYFSHPHTMTMHDLCTTLSPPTGTKHLLGLGLKFCIERGQPNQKLLDGILRLRHSLRL